MTTSASSAETSLAWEAGELVMTRVFHAPRETVFRAWTEAEHFARWFGPRGATLPFCRLDAWPGGVLHYQHAFPDYEDVWVRGTYREVAAPERVSFTCHFSDQSGARVDRPGFPREMTISVDFSEEDGGTRVTIRQTGLDSDQGEVRGWLESLDRLAEALPSIAPTAAGE